MFSGINSSMTLVKWKKPFSLGRGRPPGIRQRGPVGGALLVFSRFIIKNTPVEMCCEGEFNFYSLPNLDVILKIHLFFSFW